MPAPYQKRGRFGIFRILHKIIILCNIVGPERGKFENTAFRRFLDYILYNYKKTGNQLNEIRISEKTFNFCNYIFSTTPTPMRFKVSLMHVVVASISASLAALTSGSDFKTFVEL